MKPKINLVLALELFSVVLIAGVSLGFTTLLMRYRLQDAHTSADERLLLVEEIAREIVGPEYHDHIQDASSVSAEAYARIVDRFSHIAHRFGVQYLWSVMETDDGLRFTTATRTDVADPDSPYAAFYQRHEEPEAFAAALEAREGQPIYGTFQNSWGSGRMVLVVRRDRHGRRYIFGASRSMESYAQGIAEIKRSAVVLGVLMLLFFLLPTVWLARRIAYPITRLTTAARQLGRGEMDTVLPDSFFEEVDVLSEAFDYMCRELKKDDWS